MRLCCRREEMTPTMQAYLLFHLLHASEQRCFPWIHSRVDRDLISIVGIHQNTNNYGITCKELYLTKVAPIATIQRHVKRLLRLNVLCRRQSDRDARVF